MSTDPVGETAATSKLDPTERSTIEVDPAGKTPESERSVAMVEPTGGSSEGEKRMTSGSVDARGAVAEARTVKPATRPANTPALMRIRPSGADLLPVERSTLFS